MEKRMLSMVGVLSFGLLASGLLNVKAAETDINACVKQGECVLQSDVTIDSTVILENDAILDLNGYTITSNVPSGKATFETEYKFTVKDSKGNGVIDASKSYGLAAKYGGTLILESGKVISLYSAFTGNNTNGDMNFIINGGTLTALEGPAIYMPGQVKLEINGGTINGGISLRMGQVTINGGTIINDNPKNVDSIQDYYGYNGNVFFSNAITIFGGAYTSQNAEYGYSLNLEINGGNIESTIGNALAIYTLGKVEQDINVTINGGTFNGKDDAIVSENPDSLNLKDYSNVKVEDYKKFNNVPIISITNGTFSSDVSSLLNDGYKVVENNGVYNVQPNLVISTSDNKVTMESEKPISNDYQLVVSEKEITDDSDNIIAESQKIIAESLKESTITFEDSEVLALYDINVLDGSEIVKIDGTDKYKISIKVDENLLNKFDYVKVVYINDDGKVETIYDANVKDGIVSFETTHLSTYSVIGYNAQINDVEIVNPSTLDNISLYYILSFVSMTGLLFITLKYAYHKKNNR